MGARELGFLVLIGRGIEVSELGFHRSASVQQKCARGIDRGEGADGIEAVEEEVRVDLGLQGFELSFSGEEFGAARSFRFDHHIVQRDGEEVDHRDHRGEERCGCAEAFIQPRIHSGKADSCHASNKEYDSGNDDGCRKVLGEERPWAGRAKRQRPANIPGGEADEDENQRDRANDGSGLHGVEMPDRAGEDAEDRAQRHPCGEVEEEVPPVVKERVH